MFNILIKKVILKTFFSIELSSNEKKIALGSIANKYTKALSQAFFYGVLWIFPILFLDSSIIVSVLIPITMVAWTAWFAISLANMKQKFERFWLELTKDLFEAFSISLMLLFLLSALSLSSNFWSDYIQSLAYQTELQFLSFILWSVVLWKVVYKIFIWSLKYDINDSMLTWQNEAAEKYYRKALSLLSWVADTLKWRKSLQVANYFIWVAFYEVFTYIESLSLKSIPTETYIEQANQLIKNPSMWQKEADTITITLLKEFISLCKTVRSSNWENSLQAVKDEIFCLENNTNEDQEMIDTRLSVVFNEIATLLEEEGELLFM